MDQNLIFIGLMILIFYFVLIRPSQRRAKQHRELIQSIGPGDEIVSIGGIYGTVRAIDAEDSLVHLEIADGTVIKLARQAISRKLYPEEPVEENGSDSAPAE